MTKFKHFRREHFACNCGCGRNEIPDWFIFELDKLRDACGFPFHISSGWRCEDHPIEAKKEKPGQHNKAAADIKVKNGIQRYKIQKHAYRLGFTGIGPAQTFVHVDKRITEPVSWVY